MNELFLYLSRLLIGTLFLSVFAALLIGYLWDFFRLNKTAVILGTAVYCILGTVMDLFVAARLGYGLEEQLVFLLVIGVIPYCAYFFLTDLSLPRYLYCLGSVSIQVFFVSGLLEFFHISQASLVAGPFLPAMFCMALLSSLNVLVLFVFRRLAGPVFRDNQSTEAWKRLMFAPLSGAVALGLYYYLTDFEDGKPATLLIFTACYVALFLSDVAALYGLRISIRAAEAEERLKSANRLLATQKEQYKRLSDSIAQTRQARHDLRHHMNAISGMVEADDKEGLRQYLAQYGHTLPNSEDLLCTGNDTADIIVGHYLFLAKQNGIRVEFSLHIPAHCSIRDTDLCVLMGNCLENAIDACKKLPSERRFLQVESTVKNKYLAITVSNSYDGTAVLQDGAYLSEKRRHREAGVGLESVEAVVRQYNGEMKIEDRDGVFTVYLMLKMLNKESPRKEQEDYEKS